MPNIRVAGWVVVTILGLFVLTRSLLFFIHHDFYLTVFPGQSDAPAYVQYAQVYRGLKSLASFDLSPFTRTPLYPLFLTLFLKSDGMLRLGAVFITQQLLELVVVLGVFWLGWRWYSLWWGFWLAVLLTLFFDFALYGFLVRSEVLFTFLVWCAVFFFWWFSTRAWYSWLWIPSVCLGLATLTRPVAFFSFIPLLALTWWQLSRRGSDWRRFRVLSVLILSSFGLVISPWIIRNYRLSGQFVLQDDTGNLAYATFPGGHWRAVDLTTYLDLTGMSKLKSDRAITQFAWQRILDHPSVWLKNSLKNFLFRLWSMGFTDTYLRYFNYRADIGGYHREGPNVWSRLWASLAIWSDTSSAPRWFHLYLIFNNVLGFSMIGFSLASLVLWPLLRPPMRVAFTFMLYFWVITSPFAFSGSRYMVPMIPLLVLLIPELLRVSKRLFIGAVSSIFPTQSDYH